MDKYILYIVLTALVVIVIYASIAIYYKPNSTSIEDSVESTSITPKGTSAAAKGTSAAAIGTSAAAIGTSASAND